MASHQTELPNDVEEKPSDQPAISKSQLKKQLKRQKYLERRPEKRRIEREKKKEKRRLHVSKGESPDVEGSTGKEVDHTSDTAHDTRPRSITLMSKSTNKFRVVIDMDFENYMTDNELSKAVQQIGRIYAANRRSVSPCQLYVTSYKGKVKEKFLSTNTGCQKWDINYSDLNYQELFINHKDLHDAQHMSETSDDNISTVKISNLIYLSGDSGNVLPDPEEILKDESQIFIIGGLVDHNRHKNLCQSRADERGIKTARLPIQEYVKLTQRHILSTVTVFEILLRVLGLHQSWPQALSAIPKRKIASDNPVQC